MMKRTNKVIFMMTLPCVSTFPNDVSNIFH